MGIEEVIVSAPSDRKRMKSCNKCLKSVKVYVTCFKCPNIYHPKCFLKVPSICIDENGHIFCCQNLTSKNNSFESKLKIQENKNGKSIGKGVCDSDDGLNNNILEQEKHEKDEHIHDAGFEEGEILKELNRDRVGFVCSFCEMKYFEEQSYRRHVKLCEKNNLWLNKTPDPDEKFKKVLKCDKCNYIAKYPCLLKQHSTVHSFEKPLKCTFKSCKCSQLPDISEVKHCDCSMCEYRTASKKNLQRHIRESHSNKVIQHKRTDLGKKQFKCDTCQFETVHRRSLVAHILVKHSNKEKKYKCNDCGYSFHMKQHLRNHLDIHSKEKTQDADEEFKKIYKCNKCNYTAKFPWILKEHLTVHSFEKPLKCTFKNCKCSQSPDTSQVKHCDCGMCEYRTASKRNLRLHILHHHSNKGRKHKCNYCTYSTYVKCNIMEHKCAHLGEKQFKCDTCEYKTVYKRSLAMHMLAKHSNIEKKYKCNDCDFAAHRKYHVQRHMSVHYK